MRAKSEEKEQARLKKVKDRQEKIKKSGLAQKQLEQVHDPREDQQNALHQQFRHLISQYGIIEDESVNKYDLIVEANKAPL